MDFVGFHDQLYSRDIEAREEGGTPDIIGAVRAGLAFQLKDAVGTHTIELVESEYLARAFEAW